LSQGVIWWGERWMGDTLMSFDSLPLLCYSWPSPCSQCHEHASLYTVLKLSISVRDDERCDGVVELSSGWKLVDGWKTLLLNITCKQRRWHGWRFSSGRCIPRRSFHPSALLFIGSLHCVLTVLIYGHYLYEQWTVIYRSALFDSLCRYIVFICPVVSTHLFIAGCYLLVGFLCSFL